MAEALPGESGQGSAALDREHRPLGWPVIRLALSLTPRPGPGPGSHPGNRAARLLAAVYPPGRRGCGLGRAAAPGRKWGCLSCPSHGARPRRQQGLPQGGCRPREASTPGRAGPGRAGPGGWLPPGGPTPRTLAHAWVLGPEPCVPPKLAGPPRGVYPQRGGSSLDWSGGDLGHGAETCSPPHGPPCARRGGLLEGEERGRPGTPLWWQGFRLCTGRWCGGADQGTGVSEMWRPG